MYVLVNTSTGVICWSFAGSQGTSLSEQAIARGTQTDGVTGVASPSTMVLQ